MTQMTPLSDPRRKTLLQDFKAFYREASPASLERLDRLYTQDIEFRDPLNVIHGILALKSHLKGVYAGGGCIDRTREFVLHLREGSNQIRLPEH